MTIAYKLFDRDDEALIAAAELPVEGGIALALHTTSFDAQNCEVVELAICDLKGETLFSQRVKPQNAEGGFDLAASGGITQADVEEEPELFQFEDEVSQLFENASIVIAQHSDFAHDAIESSWISLPVYDRFDLIAEFCASHCAADYPGAPAAAADLAGVADYYGVEFDETRSLDVARTVAECYTKFVEEQIAARDAKGEAHWVERERRLAEEALGDKQLQAVERSRAIKALRINALLWLCGAAIFSNLSVQTYIGGYDAGFTICAAAAAIFAFVNSIRCLLKIKKL